MTSESVPVLSTDEERELRALADENDPSIGATHRRLLATLDAARQPWAKPDGSLVFPTAQMSPLDRFRFLETVFSGVYPNACAMNGASALNLVRQAIAALTSEAHRG